jgi:putative ABC transport system permease protein
MGPNAAVFSLVDTLLLRPLPFKEPDRLVMVWQTHPQRGLDQAPVSIPDFLDFQAQGRVFEALCPAFVLPEYAFNVAGGGEPERVQAGKAGANFFSLLGVQPALGRGFSAEEDRPGGAPVVIVGYSFWKRRFGGDAGLPGRTLRLDAVPYTVVGVAPAELEVMGKVDLWLPMQVNPAASRGNHELGVLARLKPGVTLAQAQSDLDAVARRLEREYPATNQGWGVKVVPWSEMAGGRIRPALRMLLGAVGLLLLIACANVANLLLARSAARSREMAIRAALGGGRGRLLRQLLTESVLLALIASVLGVLLAAWSLGALRQALPDFIPRLKQIQVDARVLGFTLGLSVLTGVIFGLAPAIRAARTNVHDALKEGGGRSGGAGGGSWTRNLLVVTEMALALVLAVAAGLLTRSFARLMAVDPGLRTSNVLTMQLSLPAAKYDKPKRAEFFRTLTARLETLPGVVSADAVNVLPLRGGLLDMRIWFSGFRVEGAAEPPRGQEPAADIRRITPGYFSTLGIPLRQGRFFTGQDDTRNRRVAIINETLARRHFPGENPLGRRLRFEDASWEIVGVVGDVKLYGLDKPIEPAIYAPQAQWPSSVMCLVVRTQGDPGAWTSAVRQQVLELDPDQPVSQVRTMDEMLAECTLIRRFATALLGVFAALAVALALVGIYGLMSYSVSQRVHEIGLRMALGATPPRVLAMVVGRGMVLAAAGAGVGMLGALAFSKVLRGLLFGGITATDPFVFAGMPALLIAAAALASYVPAHRATRIAPAAALRWQ